MRRGEERSAWCGGRVAIASGGVWRLALMAGLIMGFRFALGAANRQRGAFQDAAIDSFHHNTSRAQGCNQTPRSSDPAPPQSPRTKSPHHTNVPSTINQPRQPPSPYPSNPINTTITLHTHTNPKSPVPAPVRAFIPTCIPSAHAPQPCAHNRHSYLSMYLSL